MEPRLPPDTSGTGAGAPSLKTKRRPPNPLEQANRTNRIKPWAEVWKQLKQEGRWA